MSRETLKGFFAKNSIPGDSISFSHGNSPGNKIEDGQDIKFDPNTGKTLLDLDTNSPDPEGMLGDYLSFLSKEADHVYPISPGNTPSIPTSRGEYLAISSDHGAEKVFITTGEDLSSNFNAYSNGQFINIRDLVDKIGVDGDPSKGHELLSSIEGTGTNNYGEVTNQVGEDHIVVQTVQSEVLKKSRFANIPNKEIFIDKNENSNAHEDKEKLKVNNKFGHHFDDETLVRIAQLKDLGASLLMKASGFDAADNPGNSENPEELENLFATRDMKSSLLENNGIDAGLIKSKNAFGFPMQKGSDESIRSGRGEFLGHADERKSFGSTYNTGLHFSGKSHKLHKLQAALSLQVLKELSSQVYNNVISLLSADADPDGGIYGEIQDNFNESLSSPLLGSSRKLVNLQLDYIKQTVLVPTRYPYKLAFDRGLKVIFDDTLISSGKISPTPLLKGDSSSPGFWLAVSRSVIKSFDQTFDNMDLLSDSSADMIESFVKIMSSNNIIRYMNAIATVGDSSLQAFGGMEITSENFRKRIRNVDALPDSPGTRVGKNKKDNGYRVNQLAWSQNDVPSAYLLPLNPIRASGRLGKIISGPNPFTAMIGSELVDQTYFSKNMDGSANRIPKEVIETLENKLDAEYVPFYFQDLRTNEIISFHAFLNTLTDTINPNYSTFNGYGRLDPVRIYEGTTRSINVGFTVVATSKQDFNTMWYKINKFVTLLYPQWTKGTMVGQSLENNVTSKFIQPNTQVLGASPLVRMRVGDIIKSNYSKFNLARMFGIGDGDVSPIVGSSSTFVTRLNSDKQNFINKAKDYSVSLIAYVFGSPIQAFNMAKGAPEINSNLKSKALSGLTSTATNALKNGFVNPLTLGLVLNRIKDPNVSLTNNTPGSLSTAEKIAGKLSGPHKNLPVYLNSNYNLGYKIVGGDANLIGKRLMIQKPIKVKIIEKNENITTNSELYSNSEKQSNSITYRVQIIDFSMPKESINLELHCEPSDIYQMPNDTLVNTLEFGLLLAGAGGFISSALDFGLNSNLVKGFANSTGLAPSIDLVRSLYQSQESEFMDAFNNPFVKAYESTAGRGLAGTVGTVTFDWLDDFPWEIDHNSRAPIGCKINFNFDVIHDLPPGLDHSGYNRAPLYNVGDIMKNVTDDVYESFFKEDEFEFRKQSNKGTRITGKK